MTDKDKNKGKEIKRLDKSSKVEFGSVKITGDVAGSSIITGDMNASNIAGGDQNVYIVSRRDDNLIEKMNVIVEKEELSAEKRDYIINAIQQIQDQLALGSDADEARVNFVLKSIKMVSVTIFEVLVRKILSQDNVELDIKRMIKGIS